MKHTIKCIVKDGCKSNFILNTMEELSIQDKEISIGSKINAMPSGKMRMNNIFIAPDDYVLVEVDSSDVTRGRIIRRI